MRDKYKVHSPPRGGRREKNSTKAPVVLGNPCAWGMCRAESENTAILAETAHTQHDSQVSHSWAPEAWDARLDRTRDDQAISVAQPPRTVGGTPG